MTYRQRYNRILQLWGWHYMPRSVAEHMFRRAIQRPVAAVLALI